ncbi:TraB/GumN family protein [Phyllobacterium zundukense]|uniref:Polysaccharide biosynthesis protein GumN n=1 Tax=Phyllobacterium zundukense TaxID=1867719 RepID=A0A2N9VWR2_9HYPH|nr:TraB/GumN family protein [Phyllobacterium zundukense]ATU93505.1 polysaccharide biosynthesis protein GumN [Phyllobacterium zundukense]PIO43930.1 polysaccharide biosynthesis protein GumN [Phyllobacterium zundukense]
MNDKDIFPALDRIADGLLRLCLALSWLLLASFLAVAFSATRVRAEEIACGGHDLIAEMAKTDPAKLNALRKEAAETENGKGLLWKIEKPGVKPSFLFGTMHLTDPRVLKLSDAAEAAYQGADTIVIETDEVLDPKAPMKVMAETPDLMMFTDGTTLDKLIPKDKLETVRSALSERGISLAAVNRMQPWMLTSMLAMPACEFARKKEGTNFLDIKLAEEARSRGKQIAGLETIKDQLSAMASLPAQFHIDGLIETLTLGPKLPDVFETMTVLYTQGQIGMIFPLMRSVSPDGTESGKNYAEFEEKMVNARNRTMADRAVPIVDRGNAFIAVGALHLPGEQGLVALLKNKGYTLTAQ